MFLYKSFYGVAELDEDKKWSIRKGSINQFENGEYVINVRNIKTGKQVFKKSSVAEWVATGVPALAKSMGFQWGDERNIGQFGNYVDRVHFQIKIDSDNKNSGTKTITRNITKEIKKFKDVQEVDKDAIFNNFKVNPYTFNFFLKNLQFSPEYNRKEVSRQTYNSDQAGTNNNSSTRGGKLSEIVISTKKK
ncbi:MAG: hypothetical protein JWR72_1613 [Flavisolibacter sp.]|nr:hypothetical protein [Flavisolibacter sp.]